MATRHVDQQHHRHFPLFLENLDVGMVEACRHVPVYTSDIVAKLVFPHFRKGHTLALEGSVVLAGEDVLGKTAALDFYPSDAFQ